MKSYIQVFVAALSVALVAACGTKSANGPGAPHAANSTAKTANSDSSGKVKILDAEKFGKIHADDNDKAEFVAVDGQILDLAAVMQADPQGLKVRCKTRLQNVQLENGLAIDQMKVTYAKSQNQPNTYYVNIMRADYQAGQGLAIVCEKNGSSVTAAEAKTSLQGVVDLSI